MWLKWRPDKRSRAELLGKLVMSKTSATSIHTYEAKKLAGQVGRENPSELKAQKLARSVTRGLVDRDLKPDVEEKRQIDAILLYPPNRCVPFCIHVTPSA